MIDFNELYRKLEEMEDSVFEEYNKEIFAEGNSDVKLLWLNLYTAKWFAKDLGDNVNEKS